MRRTGPAFQPFASRGRKAVAAILATFALFSAVSVTLSVWATSRSQYKASVLEVAARQIQPPALRRSHPSPGRPTQRGC